MKPLRTFNYLCLLVISPFAVGQGVSRPQIPIVRATDSFSVVYEGSRLTQERAADRSKFISQKRYQYDQMVSERKISRADADQVIRDLSATPLMSDEEYRIEFFVQGSEGSVVQRISGKLVAWSIWTNDYTVSFGWQGGDSLVLDGRSEPYTGSQTNVPILPVQFPGIKLFVDLEEDGEAYKGRMLTVSTGVDSYLPCDLMFKSGHLSRAQVGTIEVWNYRNYKSGKIPLPEEITLQRLFNDRGEPQVTTRFRLVGEQRKRPSLDELIVGNSVTVLDSRSDPPGQFTYTKGRGSILTQSMSAVPVPTNTQPQGTVTEPLPLAAYLVGGGLAIAAGLALMGLLRSLRTNRPNRKP